ncbi:hypothetical protein FHT00_003598 [Sphingomonas insulae]|uniref:Ferritin-like domain-containing protein n=1 Tax=Sphingomonas insulae TaxID=424800 RepID=A0ABN1I167_9SPHN|nr:ferritin-like domain-containing protein [Sphingomonas insulae]NIJ31617.1 hypothetical protein [Sphingomonas insulae]
MANIDDRATDVQRRRFLHVFGAAAGAVGGLTLLSACGGDGDTPTTGATPTPTPTPTSPPPTPGPTYTATDADRLNFLLQVNYLVGNVLTRGVLGQALPAAMTGGAGTAGAVSGGAQVSITDAFDAAMLREITFDVQAQIVRLRAILGSAATAQPATTIAGGASGPFAAIATAEIFAAANITDIYALPEFFLSGVLALTSLRSSVFNDVVRLVSDQTTRGVVAGLSAVASQHDATIRQILWFRGRAQNALYGLLDRLSDARERFDGNRDFDQGVGFADGVNFAVTDGEAVSLRRTPEQVLNVLYATQSAVSSGGFFPAGINGLIRFSGANTQ